MNAFVTIIIYLTHYAFFPMLTSILLTTHAVTNTAMTPKKIVIGFRNAALKV